MAAAEAAERVFGYAQAAAHWQRASELGQAQPDAAAADGIDVPRLSVRAIDAFFRAGDSVRAGLVAEEAYRRFAGHPDPGTAAVVRHRAAYFRANDAPTDRAAADGGGAAAVRAGSAVIRSRRRPARLRQHLPAVRRGAGSGQRRRAGPGAGDRRSGRRHGADPPHPARHRGRRVRARSGRGGVRRPGAGVGTGPGHTGRPGAGAAGHQRKRRSAQARAAPKRRRRGVARPRYCPAGRPGGLGDGRRRGRQRR